MAARSCRRPQWLLWGLDQGLLWLQVPGGAHLNLAGGLNACTAVWGPFQGSWEDQVLVQDSPHSRPGVQSLPPGEPAT